MSTPLVSVLMPVFNGAHYLQAAITSVRQQTYPHFELIVVDDGSTDGTGAILAAEAQADSRIVVITQPANRGVVVARNTALQRARGEFIAVLDSDDVALPHRLADQIAFMHAHPDIAVLGGAIQLIDHDGVAGGVKTYPVQPGLVAWSMFFFNSIAHSTVMIRRDCATSEYPPGGAEDYGLLANLGLRVRMANLPQVLVKYRVSPGGLTSRAWARQEEHADQIVQAMIAQVTGSRVSIDQVRVLRGLSRDQYPADPQTIRTAADLILALAARRTQSDTMRPEDVAAVRRDAGTRVLLLAALAARRSPSLGASLAARAMRLSPGSLPAFTAKATRSVLKRLGIRGSQS